MPKASVVIPVYNAERFLAECLDSVLAQTCEDIEIVCVDDGSTDGSAAILAEFADKDPRVSVVTQHNQGAGAARNAGLDRASGEYVLFLDADDTLEPDTVELASARCDEDAADIGVFKIRYVYVDRGVSVDADWSLRLDLLPETVPFSHRDIPGAIFTFTTPCVWNKLLRRSFVLEAGLRFSSELKRAEDLPFTFLALVKAERITVVDKPLVSYRTGFSSSRQATIHEEPLEICKALVATKQLATDAGVFREIEADFVSAALYQCLFTLDTLKTPSAFETLFDALKSTYFSELGIDSLPAEKFVEHRHHESYLAIRDGSAQEYLFSQTRDLQYQLTRRIDEVRFRRSQVTKRLEEIRTLKEAIDQLQQNLKERSAALRAAEAKIRRIEESRTYRIARGMTGAAGAMRRTLHINGKKKP